MRISKYSVVFFLLSYLFLGCEKDAVVPHFVGFADDYFHIKKNTTWVYQVDSVYNDNGKETISTYFEKHFVIDSIVTGNTLTISVQVFKSIDSITGYNPSRTYRLIFNEQRVKLLGNNVDMIVLERPLVENKEWLSAQPLCGGNTVATIDEIHPLYEIRNKTYTDVISVRNCWLTTFDLNNIHRSFYTKNIGLVKEIISYHYSNRFGASTRRTITKSLLTYAY